MALTQMLGLFEAPVNFSFSIDVNLLCPRELPLELLQDLFFLLAESLHLLCSFAELYPQKLLQKLQF